MIYGFENKNIELSQLSDICEDGKYKSFKIDKTFVMEIYNRTSSGRIIPPEPEQDAEEQLLNVVKEGDTVITSTLVNFSVDIAGSIMSLELFFNKGVRVVAILEDFDSASYDETVLKKVYKMISKFQVHSRQSKLAAFKARKKGRSVGRKPLSPSDVPDFENFYNKYMKREINKEEFAQLIKVSRPTLDKLIKRYSEQNEERKKETD